jgi:hypothetical protein
MPIKVTCPKCQGVLHAPDDAGGKRGKCPTCGTVLQIPADGPKVAAGTEPAFRAPEAAPEEAPGTQRSSFGAIPRPADVEARRAPPGGGSRMPPPPTFAPPEPKKLPDPFAKAGKRPVAGVPGDGLVRAWRRTRRGLGWVQFALFLFLLAFLGRAGLAVAEKYGVQLPSKDPGYLKVEGLGNDREIRWAVLLVPSALALLICTLGRFGVSNAPRSSFAKGLATAAALGTLLVLCGAIAFGVPTGMQIAEGFVPQDLLPKDDPTGLAQRVGLGLVAVFGVLAEVWFVTALGRMGAALHDYRLGGRATRFVVLVGLAVAVALFVWGAFAIYPRESGQYMGEYVQPQWDKLGEHKLTVRWGLIGLGGLLLWAMYARLVSAGRRAIRDWLETNEPGR